MQTIAIARSFIEALAALEPVAAKRTAAFLDKVVRDPASAGIHAERVHSASDRSIRSLRVTNELRAIARVAGDRLVLLFVGHHETAYSWAAAHCIGCADSSVVELERETAMDSAGWWCSVENGAQLCSVLDRASIPHSLAQ